MPAVESPHRRTVVIMIRIPYQIIMPGIIRISKKRRAISLFYRLAGFLHGETPWPSEIILHPGSADRRIFPVPVYVKLHFAFPPPIPLQGWQRNISSDILPLPFNTVRNHIILSKLRQFLPSPLRMEIRRILRKGIIQSIIDLIEKRRYRINMLILQCEQRLFPERHLEICIQSSGRNDRDQFWIHQTLLPESAAEKVSQRNLRRRFLLSVPVHAEHQIAQHETVTFRGLSIHRHPDMMDHSCPVDLT